MYRKVSVDYNNVALNREAINMNDKYGKWGMQGRKTTTFERDPDGCNNHWMVISDETGINTHCEYCGFVEYLPKSKAIRRIANENQPSNRQILRKDREDIPSQNHYIKVRVRMTP